MYFTLNRLNVDVTSKVLIGEAWVPCVHRDRVTAVLRDAALTSATQLSAVVQTLPSAEMPPTYYQTNKFTGAFQVCMPMLHVLHCAPSGSTPRACKRGIGNSREGAGMPAGSMI